MMGKFPKAGVKGIGWVRSDWEKEDLGGWLPSLCVFSFLR
jgi:hypothetical protein